MTSALKKYSPSGRAHPTSLFLVSVQGMLAGVVLGLLLGLLTSVASIRLKVLIVFVGALAPALIVVAMSRLFHIRNAVAIGVIAAFAGLATAYGHMVLRIADVMDFESWIWNPFTLVDATNVISASLYLENSAGAVRELTQAEAKWFRLQLFGPFFAYPIANWLVGATIGSKQPPYCEKCGSWLTEPLDVFYFSLGDGTVTRFAYELKKTGLDNLLGLKALSPPRTDNISDYVRLDVFGCCEKKQRLVGRIVHSCHAEHADIDRSENDLTGHFLS